MQLFCLLYLLLFPPAMATSKQTFLLSKYYLSRISDSHRISIPTQTSDSKRRFLLNKHVQPAQLLESPCTLKQDSKQLALQILLGTCHLVVMHHVLIEPKISIIILSMYILKQLLVLLNLLHCQITPDCQKLSNRKILKV